MTLSRRIQLTTPVVEPGAAADIPLNDWTADKYIEEYRIMKALFELSGEAAQDAARYPLLDFYVALFKKAGADGDELPEELTEKIKMPKNGVEMDIEFAKYAVFKGARDKLNKSIFPYNVSDLIVNQGFAKAEDAWKFTLKKDDDKVTNAEMVEAKYTIAAMVDFFRFGYQKSKYRKADEKEASSFICEGRLNPNIVSKQELYEAAGPYFKELFETTRSAHPLNFDDFSGLRGIRGRPRKEIWIDYFTDLCRMFNENLYAKGLAEGTAVKTPKGRGKGAAKGSSDAWEKLQIEIPGDESKKKSKKGKKGEEAREGILREYKTWILYTLISDYFNKTHAQTIRYNKIHTGFLQVEQGITATLNEDYNNDRFIRAMEEGLDYIERKAEGFQFDGDDIINLGEIKASLDATIKSSNGKIMELQRVLRVLLRMIRVDLYANLKKMNMSSMENLYETRIAALQRGGVLQKDEAKELLTPENINLKITQTKIFIRTLLEPIDYMAISYAILTMNFMKYNRFLNNISIQCQDWIDAGAEI